MRFPPHAGLLLVIAFAALDASCAQEDMPQSVWDERHPLASADGGRAANHVVGGADDATTPAMSRGPSPDGGPMPPPAPGTCVQALAQPMPSRLAVLSGHSTGTGPAVAMGSVQGIVNGIAAGCNLSGCHPGSGFQVAASRDLFAPAGEGFPNQGEWAIAHIEGDLKPGAQTAPCIDTASCEAMPPLDNTSASPGAPWSQRQSHPNDPVVRLDLLLAAWIAAGDPDGPFPLAEPPGDDSGAPSTGGASSFAMSPDVGSGMTNLGNCIPERSLLGSDTATMATLDAKFAALRRALPGAADQASVIGMPALLSQTDLTTFDGAALARTGVVAFVPQYPLWTDDTDASRTGKLRLVRVPLGKSIAFDKNTQEFDIPENTRFYKTFLKRIVDTDGNPSWRKIETRLIVSRPDTVNPDGTPHINALYGTYMWNDDETEAQLVGSTVAGKTVGAPLHSGDGFEDSFFGTTAYSDESGFPSGGYETDVNLAAQVRARFDPTVGPTLEEELVGNHALRHYALPSSTRCVDCHMGSPGRSFILGFRPVQLAHRPLGVGGVVEPSGPDEMSQLERLIAYGVISGVAAPSDILPLEDSEGDRKPRNAYELVAQGYMLGNCSHCHNPRGKPSVEFPVLRAVLDFVPGKAGGIFQFPLEKFSPRIHRGLGGNVPIPYITPSLLDDAMAPPVFDPVLGDGNGVTATGTAAWLPKWRPDAQPEFIYAPWRSLIYRNVDTPFTYSDDFTIYPHMPINSPGYDCRAKQILGDWMVSIPAVRKRPDIAEYAQPYPLASNSPTDPNYRVSFGDPSPQPYVEVSPGAPGYDVARTAAAERLAIFHAGARPGETVAAGSAGIPRYAACPDTWDILDPDVNTCHAIPTESVRYDSPAINVPTHAHWVPLDLTQSGSAWTPRGASWRVELVEGSGCPDGGGSWTRSAAGTCLAGSDNGCSDVDPKISAEKLERTGVLVGLLQSVTLAPVEEFLTRPVPLALWTDKPACDWTRPPWKEAGPTLDQVRATDPRPWMNTSAGADGSRHVYSASLGAAVFDSICINCHGPSADSRGRLADNLATMTGGHTKVADLRDGLFGPPGHPDDNRRSVFMDAATADVTTDDWGARYMAYMALGGTRATIPEAFLSTVAHAPVFGEVRGGTLNAPASPNMLSTVQALCLTALQTPPFRFADKAGFFASHPKETSSDILLWDSGDAEMWLKLCSLNNPPPVVPYQFVDSAIPPPPTIYTDSSGGGPDVFTDDLLSIEVFPELRWDRVEQKERGAECAQPQPPAWCAGVGDENGGVAPLSSAGVDGATGSALPRNLHPWCVWNPQASWLQVKCVGGKDCSAKGDCTGLGCVHPPVCPPDLALWDNQTGSRKTADSATLTWALRGAVNAGLAVFLYLDAIAHGTAAPQPAFDQCDQLTTGDAGAP